MNLEALSSSRQNNLNLIRVVAALCVLVSHSYTLASGDPSLEPLRARLGISLGTLAVDVFFVVSGFLVSASASQRGFLGYLKARSLRIYPALIAMLVATVFVLCAFFTVLPIQEYLKSEHTLGYFYKNAVLLFGVEYFLPGVFERNPYPSAVNGPLWTLVVEVRLYLIVGVAYLLAAVAMAGRDRVIRVVGTLAVIFSLSSLLYAHFVTGKPTEWLRLYYMFAVGAAIYSWRQLINLHWAIVAMLAAGVVMAYFAWPRYFMPIWAVSLPILVMWVACVPFAWARAYNSVGDYSYGIYIYAFPVQQALTATVEGIAPFWLIVLTSLITIPCAIASWHLVEKPALRLKGASYWGGGASLRKGAEL